MKKMLRSLLVMILLAVFILCLPVKASEDLSLPELVNLANKEIITAGLQSWDYFGLVNKESKELSENPHLTGYRNVIVYGNVHGDFKNDRYRYLGYTMSNAFFTNYLFRNDTTSSVGLWDRNWIVNPKRHPLTEERAEVKDDGWFNNNPYYEESIRLGLKLISRKDSNGNPIDFPEDKLNTREWNKYVHIYQPPTSVSWGCGIMFHNPSGNQVYYLTVPLSPDGITPPQPLVPEGDISAHFDILPSSAAVGEKVQVAVNISSYFETNLKEVPFKWDITRTDGTTLNAISDKLEFVGDSNEQNGKLDIPTDKKEAILYASFIMPDSDVKIKFSVNEDGKNPIEKDIDNNRLDSGEAIKAVPDNSNDSSLKVLPFDLDYNVLSRKVKFYLNENTAKLTLPRGSWNGNATGELNVVNDSEKLFRDFQVRNNPEVKEESTTISRTPQIHLTLIRSDFKDNPVSKLWLNPDDPCTPKTLTGSINYSGSVERKYRYSYTHSPGCMTREDGSKYCNGHTRNSKTSASFISGKSEATVRSFIYNGRKDMPHIESRDFENKVLNNGAERNLYWISDPYKFDILRWMCHIDENGNQYNWTKVDGQYKRTFIQQNTASINWAVKKPMASLYEYDRENARNMKRGKEYYPNVVFSTDKILQKYEWPVKSGYYFNPLGEYTCTVKTVQYKNSTNNTNEHAELVSKIKNSFHYTSNMKYTKDGKIYQNLDLHNGNNKIFGVDMLKISSTFNKKQTKLEHYDESAIADNTHQYFKEILEGYKESKTEESKNNFKYREYIKQGDIYKVEETTVITFKIEPPSENQKLYTFIGMEDGNYTVNARVDKFSLGNYGYNGLDVTGFSTIDKLQVTVNGSMYDDTNSVIKNGFND